VAVHIVINTNATTAKKRKIFLLLKSMGHSLLFPLNV
jgi:hypothetical protein